MIETKKILSQIKKFLDSSVRDFTDPLLDAVVGYNFQAQMESERNKHLIQYLKDISANEKDSVDINEFIIASMHHYEKKLIQQNLIDLQKAVNGILQNQYGERDSLNTLYSDVRMMIDDPHSFIQSTLRMEEDTARMEHELSNLVSLPCFEELSVASIEECEFLRNPGGFASPEVLKIRKTFVPPEVESILIDAECTMTPVDAPLLTLRLPTVLESNSAGESDELMTRTEVYVFKPGNPQVAHPGTQSVSKTKERKVLRLTC